MNVFKNIVLVLNSLLIIVFLVDLILIKNEQIKPKLKADMGVLVVSVFLLYLATISILAIGGTLIFKNPLYLGFLLFCIIPFILGYFVTYKKLLLYSFAQLMAFCGSLACLYIL